MKALRHQFDILEKNRFSPGKRNVLGLNYYGNFMKTFLSNLLVFNLLLLSLTGNAVIPSLTPKDSDALFIDFNAGIQDLSPNKRSVACVGKGQASLLKTLDDRQVLSLDGTKENILYAAYTDTLVSPEGVIAEIVFKVPSSVKDKTFYLLQNGHNWGISYDRGLIRGYVMLGGVWRIVTLPQRIALDAWQQIRFNYLAATRKATLSLNGREMAREDFSDLKLSNYELKAQEQRIAIGWNASGWKTVPMTGEISSIKITLPKPGKPEAKNAIRPAQKKTSSGENFDPSPVRHPRFSTIEGKTQEHPTLDKFSDLSRWNIEFDAGIVAAKLYRGEVEKMWNDTNLKLAFKIVPEANALGTIYVRPKQPITITRPVNNSTANSKRTWTSKNYRVESLKQTHCS